MKLAIRIIALALLITTGFVLTLGKSENYIRSRVVKLSSDTTMCTGEQVRAPSGVDYILTAGHCKVIQDSDGNVLVTTEDGKKLKRKVIAEDTESDLLLVEGLPNVEGLEIATDFHFSQSVRTFTHGSNLATHKTQGELVEIKTIDILVGLVGDEYGGAKACATKSSKYKQLEVDTLYGHIAVCVMSVEEVVTTAAITPGSSGGPVVDNSGALVGVASAADGSFGYLVPLKQIKTFISNY